LICVSKTDKSSTATRRVEVRTARRTQLVDITADVAALVEQSGCQSGVCYLFVPHTTAGVTINEGDDPDVARDIEAAMERLVPREAGYRHEEGNSDSHIRAALAGVSEAVLVEDGQLVLGRWQAILFCEFDGPRQREVCVKIVADATI
jgi:secondary thiamine-phosphate synthase enzyme